MPSERLGLDAPKCTRDEAVELFVHHVQLAAMYFLNAPEDPKAEQVMEELSRKMSHPQSGGGDDYELPAARLFAMKLTEACEAMKKEYGDV